MLKEYTKQIGRKLSDISKNTGIPYSTLNDIANGKIMLEKVAYGTVKRLALELGLSLSQLEDVCADTCPSGEKPYKVYVKNKSYYIKIGETEERLFKVNALNTRYVEFAAQSIFDSYQKEREMDAKWTEYITSCGKTNR